MKFLSTQPIFSDVLPVVSKVKYSRIAADLNLETFYRRKPKRVSCHGKDDVIGFAYDQTGNGLLNAPGFIAAVIHIDAPVTVGCLPIRIQRSQPLLYPLSN